MSNTIALEALKNVLSDLEIGAHPHLHIDEIRAAIAALEAQPSEVERLAAQSAPLQQAAREYPPLPKMLIAGRAGLWCLIDKWRLAKDDASILRAADEVDGLVQAALRAYVDADRAAAQVEPVRMLTEDEIISVGKKTNYNIYYEAELQRAFCRVNAGRVIPSDRAKE